MGELIVITGGSKSGKSALAETVAAAFGQPLCYIATMEPFGREAKAAIARHREMRRGKGFATYERTTGLAGLVLPQGCAALVEDMGNLLANEIFSAREPRPVEKICAGIAALREQAGLLVVVTNQVGDDGIAYPRETMDYIRHLGTINARLAAAAGRVAETVCGIPIMLKGEWAECWSSR